MTTMPGPDIPLATLDATLARFRAATETASARLLELDGDPAAALLINGPLTGMTAARWELAGQAQARLWNSRTLLEKLVETASRLRGEGRKLGRDEQRALAALLTGRSIELETLAVPAAQRSLLGPTQTVRRCSADELLISMTNDYATVGQTVAQVSAAWAPLADRIAALQAGIGGLAAAGGQDAAAARLGDRLDALRTMASQDPLGCDGAGLATLEAGLVQARAALSSAGELAAILHERIARARVAMGEVRTLRQQTEAVHQRAAVAISGTPSLEALTGEAAANAELCALEALAAAGHVRSVLPRLTVWERGIRATRNTLTGAATRDTAALAERSELRGRFDAYQAMAARRGVAEDPVLVELAKGVRDRLMTAPCSLPAAASAVAAYQAELSRRASAAATSAGAGAGTPGSGAPGSVSGIPVLPANRMAG